MTSRQRAVLLAVAAFGLIIPNGMFFYYLFVQFSSVSEILNNLRALGFIIDDFMATGLISWWLAYNPIGRYSWKVFIVLSLIGGLGFSLPFFWYLNKR